MRVTAIALLCCSIFSLPALAEEAGVGEGVFANLDGDKNGQVSEEEFVAAATERARAHFKRVDGNGDGQLTLEEFRDAGKVAREDLQKMRERMKQREPAGNFSK